MPQLPPQRPDESPRAYAAFVGYCELGEGRSIEKVCQKHAKNVPTAKRWSAQHEWQARVREYDTAVIAERAAALDRVRQQEIAAFREEIVADQATLRSLWRGAANKLAKRLLSLDEADIEVQHLAPLLRAVAALAEATTNQKASAMGVTDVLKYLESKGDAE